MTSLGYQFILYNSHVRDAVAESLRTNDTVKSSRTVFFDIDMSPGGVDYVPDLFFARMQVHEFNDILLTAYGDRSRAGYSYNWGGDGQIADVLALINDCCRYPNYLCDNQRYGKPYYVVMVRRGPEPLSVSSALGDQIVKLLFPQKYKEKLKRAISLSLVPL